MVRVLFFGRLADAFGRERAATLASHSESVRMLTERIASKEPALMSALSATRVRFAVGDEIVPDDRIVADGDEISVLPPFSGG
ncbi:MAG: MoaD/ThiS family protein [Pseudomonadota bacterium]